MENKQLTAALVGLVAGVIITAFAYPGWGYDARDGWRPMMSSRQNMMGGSSVMGSIDQHFIEQMIPHHEDAIAMAKLALERSTRPEIRTLAENIIEAQDKENSQMRAWYKDWFDSEVPSGSFIGTPGHMMGEMVQGGMHGGMMGDTTDLEELRSADEFDKAFIKEMIPHHQMAIMMAQMLAVSTTRDEMRKLADDIIEAQTTEIEQMRSWYSAWYPAS